MSLAAGGRIGSYEIVGLIGAGGMGEVYRALDTKLKREVAVKVLPDTFADDPGRMIRFQREAEVLASLNHPNIATIYGVEERALVMELVEGETLKGPLPLETTIKYAKQIAEALEYAHERGIIHRDLKPANIKLTPDGTIKLLDFGLAKATENPSHSEARVTDSPTLTMGSTQAGVILGTAAYMSPEQARGTRADKRSDIWAFGVVLYEMLMGRRLFTGEMTSDILVAVIKDEPDLSVVPEQLRPLIARCLKKNPKQRLRDIGEARIALENPETEGNRTSSELVPRRPTWWIAATAALGAIAAGALWLAFKPSAPSEPRPIIHFTQTLPAGSARGIAISPDGSRLAYVAASQAGIYVRTMDQPEAKLLPGTEGAGVPTFSPDGESLAFMSIIDGVRAQLKKTSLISGTTSTILPGLPPGPPYVNWGEDDNLYYVNGTGSLTRVPSSGGKQQLIGGQEDVALNPQLLPGGKTILLSASNAMTTSILALDLKTGMKKMLIAEAGVGRFVPSHRGSDQGYILWQNSSDGSLLAAPFDAGRLQVGPSVPVLSELRGDNFAISPQGTLAYVPGVTLRGGVPGTQLFTLVWVNRQGTEEPISGPPRVYTGEINISPNGSRAALVERTSATTYQILVFDFERGSFTPITSGQDAIRNPVWPPDGKRLIYTASNHAQPGGVLVSMSADGRGAPTVLAPGANFPTAAAIASDGTIIGTLAANNSRSLFLLSPPGVPSSQNSDSKPRPFPDSPAFVGSAQLSPNGKWLAYDAGSSRRARQIYLVPYPGPGPRTTIADGTSARWSRDGSELFYIYENQLYVVDPFHAGKPTRLFRMSSSGRTGLGYDIGRDGRILTLKEFTPAPSADAAAAAQRPAEMHVIVNWLDQIRRKVPMQK
jgi:serine/threonine-protein kinase